MSLLQQYDKVENASRAAKCGMITPENFEPNPKNPIIAAFFRNIGLSDQLGSGVRNLFKYSKYYSGKEPIMTEDDVFRIVVPLNDNYSFDLDGSSDKSSDKEAISSDKKYSLHEEKIIAFLLEHSAITNAKARELTGLSAPAVKKILKKMVDKNILSTIGENKSRVYQLVQK
jgi:ATP-dependent DNA helicase RecG